MIHTRPPARKRTAPIVTAVGGVWLGGRRPRRGPIGPRNFDRNSEEFGRLCSFRSIPQSKRGNTGSAYVSTSSSEGLFAFPELQPGTYTLEVNAAGFAEFQAGRHRRAGRQHFHRHSSVEGRLRSGQR